MKRLIGITSLLLMTACGTVVNPISTRITQPLLRTPTSDWYKGEEGGCVNFAQIQIDRLQSGDTNTEVGEAEWEASKVALNTDANGGSRMKDVMDYYDAKGYNTAFDSVIGVGSYERMALLMNEGCQILVQFIREGRGHAETLIGVTVVDYENYEMRTNSWGFEAKVVLSDKLYHTEMRNWNDVDAEVNYVSICK